MYWRIIVERSDGQDFIALDYLTQDQAEEQLCRFLNEGYDAYMQESDYTEERVSIGDGY